MRLVAGLVAVILAAAPLAARSDDTAPPPPAPESNEAKAAKVPLRVVRVMPESNQALLFDRLKNTHVLAELGGTVSGYHVDDITDDEVTLSIFNRQVVLAAPQRNHREQRGNHVRSASANAPADPYDDVRSVEAPGAPSDPYADEPVRSVEAPDAAHARKPHNTKPPAWADADAVPRVVEAPTATPSTPRVVEAPGATPSTEPGADPAAPRVVEAPNTVPPPPAPRVVEAPISAAPTAAAPRVVEAPHKAGKATAKHDTKAHDAAEEAAVAELFANATTATPTAAKPAKPAAKAPGAHAGQVTLARADVDTALADFGRLADAIHGDFTPNGVKIDGVAEGSLFERAGLRAGDTIASVNGVVPRSLDDAANIYALASSVKTMTVLIVRDGKQSALRIAIQ